MLRWRRRDGQLENIFYFKKNAPCQDLMKMRHQVRKANKNYYNENFQLLTFISNTLVVQNRTHVNPE